MVKEHKCFRVILFVSLAFAFSCGEKSDNGVKKYYQGKTDSAVTKEIESFYFVGSDWGRVGIYKYDLKNSNTEEFWSSNDESVVKLLYSDELDYAFFLAAKRFGVKGGVAFINDLKLYRIDLESSKVELTAEIGDAVQMYADWIGMNFQIQFTRFDMKFTSHINRFNRIYSPFGKLIKEEFEIFNFIEGGYPQFDIQRISLLSPSEKFGIKQRADSLYFLIADNQQKILIDSTGEFISNVKWSKDEEFLFFSTRNEVQQATEKAGSTLYVFNIEESKLVRSWNSESRMNFLITNKLLLFDSGVGNKTSVQIYNYRNDGEINEITLHRAVGLTDIIED